MDKIITTPPPSHTTTPSLPTTTTNTHTSNTLTDKQNTHYAIAFENTLQKLITLLEQLKATKHHAKLAISKNNLPQHRKYRRYRFKKLTTVRLL